MLGKSTKRLLAISLLSVCIFAMGGCAASQSSKGNDSASKPAATSTSDKSSQQSDKPPAALMDTTPVEPTRVFDNLYYLGNNGVGAWMVNTSQGIILIDSMWNSKDAENIIVGGMRKLGFDPTKIKYVLVTHGHGDHYGGAQYIKDNFGATILMSAVDWDFMNKNSTGPNAPEFPKPKSYTAITDGEKLTLGDTTITIVSTPGHTPGGVSLIIPVTDNGTKHMVGMWGGTGLPKSLEDNKAYLNSLDYFAKFTDAAQVDTEITAHQFVDNGLERMNTLRKRKAGDPNPFVIGQEAYKAYMEKMKTSVLDNIKKLTK